MEQENIPVTEYYQFRSGAGDLGREYEYKMLALLALRCMKKNVDDFRLASNMDGMGAFDDLILHVQQKNKCISYYIQTKHKEITNKNITEREFKAEWGDFSLKKYFNDLENLYNSSFTNKTNQGVYFIIFTNRGTNEYAFLEPAYSKELLLLNTANDNKNVYKVKCHPSTTSHPSTTKNYGNITLLTKQTHVKQLFKLILVEIERFNLPCVNVIEVAQHFIKFIMDWYKGDLDGYYYLTKKHISAEFQKILFSNYMFDLRQQPYVFYDYNILWNTIVEDKFCTIVDRDEDIDHFLKLYISTVVKPFYMEDFKMSWIYKLNDRAQARFYRTHFTLKSSFAKLVGNFGKLTLWDVYLCLWLNHKIPLLLEVYSFEEFNNVIEIYKKFDYSLKIVILNKSGKTLPDVSVSNSFVTLCDLSDKKIDMILEKPVFIQGRSGAKLKDIVDSSLYKFITCKDIIHILLGNFNIGSSYKELFQYFINRAIFKIIVNFEILEESDEIFYIKTDFNDENLVRQLNKLSNVFLRDPTYEEINSRKTPIHCLIINNNGLLEWQKSYGSSKIIRKYQVNIKYVQEWKYLCNDLNKMCIISACPGMGKSTFFDYISLNLPPDIWVLKINLNDYCNYYENLDYVSSVNHLNYFNTNILTKYKCNNHALSQMIFEKFLKSKQVFVLLDGFDEIFLYKDQVMTLCKTLYKDGFCVWVTTRSHLANILEDEFATVAFTLKPFSVNDQTQFLFKYFNQIYPNNEKLISKFIEKLLEVTHRNLDRHDYEFTGIPLQTRLLAEVFTEDLKATINGGTICFYEDFNLLYLYEEFVRRKTEIVCNKFGIDARNMHTLFLKHQQLFALQFIFSIKDLSELNLDKEFEFYQHENNRKQLLQRDGILMIREDKDKFKIDFVHRTFAEYLSAQWLSDNYNCNSKYKNVVKRLIKLRYKDFLSDHYRFLFRLFDCMLAKDYPAHLALITGRLNDAKKLLDAPCTTDKGGRTLLHIAAHKGVYHPTMYIADNFSDYFNDNMLEIVQIIIENGQRNDNLIKPDMLGFTAFDISVLSQSLAIANKIAEEFHEVVINVPFDYGYFIQENIINCCVLNYDKLLKVLFIFLIKQDLLFDPSLKITITIEKYVKKMLSFKKKTKYFNKFQELNIKTISELLEKMEIKSLTLPYYYDLRFAIILGTLINIEHLLSKVSEINRIDLYGNNALHYAVLHERTEIIDTLLLKGVDVNVSGKDGDTPLHIACKKRYLEILSKLLLPRTNINKKNNEGETPLISALKKKDIKIAKLLIKNGADIKLCDNSGYSCLHYAIEIKDKNLVCYFLDKGLDINRKGKTGNTPLSIALEKRCVAIAELLISRNACTLYIDSYGDSYLHQAAKNDLQDMANFFISKGLDINKENTKGYTPLLYALIYKRKAAIKLLLLNNARMDLDTNDGTTCLHYVVQMNDTKLVSQFLKKDTNIDKQNKNGKTPLMMAIENRNLNVIKLLLSKGANYNLKDNDENSPLHYAAEYNCFKALRILINKGCDVNIKNKFNKTPLHLSVFGKKYMTIYDCIRQLKIVDFLLDNNADINCQDQNGETVLHYPIKFNYTNEWDNFEERFYKDVFVLLLNKNIDISLKNNKGKTVLNLAHDLDLTEFQILIYQKIINPNFKLTKITNCYCTLL